MHAGDVDNDAIGQCEKRQRTWDYSMWEDEAFKDSVLLNISRVFIVWLVSVSSRVPALSPVVFATCARCELRRVDSDMLKNMFLFSC